MDKDERLRPGYIVQLTECEQKTFKNKLMTITEVRPWGAIGEIDFPKGKITYRSTWDEMELVSHGIS